MVISNIHTHNPATRRLEQLHRQQSQQSQSNHSNILANSHICLPNPLQGNRSQRCKCCFFKADALWDFAYQVFGNSDNLCVNSVTSTSTGYSIPRQECCCIRGYDFSCTAIPQLFVVIQAILHFLNRCPYSFPFHICQHLPNQIRPGSRFANQ